MLRTFGIPGLSKLAASYFADENVDTSFGYNWGAVLLTALSTK